MAKQITLRNVQPELARRLEVRRFFFEPGKANDMGGASYEYEPEEDEILAELLPRNVAVPEWLKKPSSTSPCSG